MKLVIGATTALAILLVNTAPKPGVTLSNRLAATKDARVLTATMTPRATWQGPYRWKITVNDTVRWTATAQRVVDTTTLGFPSCVRYRATVFPYMPAKDSLTRVLTLCRTGMPDEVAQLDSYPSMIVRATKARVPVGDSSLACAMRRNRYNGTVQLYDPKCAEIARDVYREGMP